MTYTFQPRGVCSRAMTVEVDDQGVRVTGKQGSFVPPTPMDLHWPGKASPSIASWERRWKEPLV